jgi:hypothetical protein
MPKLWRVGDPIEINGQTWHVVAKCDPPIRYAGQDNSTVWFDVRNFAGQRQMWCPWPEGAE